jgi:N-carbamoylsarcosine amidase
MSREIMEALERVFSAESEIYRDRGFGRRIGFGRRPALLIIDLGYGWTRPDNPFSCEDTDTIVLGVQRLLVAAREKAIPIVYTTTSYQVTEGPNTDMGLWHFKLPIEGLTSDSEDAEIDERIAPQDGEHLIVKKMASAFHGTNLTSLLNAADVDTVIVTGVAVAGCVRHSVEDALAEGFRPIVVRECVGDHVPGAVAWNLFDIDTRFGDVESLETVLGYLGELAPFDQQELSGV